MTSVMDKIKVVRLRWFGHVKRRCIDALVMRCKSLVIKCTMRDKNMPKKYQGEVIRQNMTQINVTKDPSSRKIWRTRIRLSQ
ncbi:hypothetical protein H5410_055364 [Solanum commersonii]|uniref:Uncharacterized protein n=1 Tax=Solanum commersonii TaxID=4109 RepID=A0A9J5WK32_SOLCO|nr:hypothetical protein H5410_055364 [Solanum commersonii]